MRVCSDTISLISQAATAVGVFIAGGQLYLSRKQSQTAFEDGLAQEYRAIALALPVNALLIDPLSDAEKVDSLKHFYHYFDLCNQQVFLRRRRRLTRKTWSLWCDGIRSNMKRSAFADQWKIVSKKSGGDFRSCAGWKAWAITRTLTGSVEISTSPYPVPPDSPSFPPSLREGSREQSCRVHSQLRTDFVTHARRSAEYCGPYKTEPKWSSPNETSLPTIRHPCHINSPSFLELDTLY